MDYKNELKYDFIVNIETKTKYEIFKEKKYLNQN